MSCKNYKLPRECDLEAPCSSSVSRCAANAEFRIEFRIAIPYRDCITIGILDSAAFTTKRGSLGIRIPDSSSVSRLYRDTIAIRNSFCVPGWPVLSLMLRKFSRHSPAEGASARVFVAGRFGRRVFRHDASKLSHQTPQCKILLVSVIPAVEEPDCCAYLSRQKLACVVSSS